MGMCVGTTIACALLRRICNPTALNIWICNPLFSRITNAYIHCGRISNPPEQTLTFDF